jgi:hypothetical protein
MSQFTNPNGSVKTYAVVDAAAQEVLGVFGWAGEADKGMKELQRGRERTLDVHNVTHPKCPDWLKEIVKSDKAYCTRRADENDGEAAALRRRAAEIVAEAERFEARAAGWRRLAEAAPEPDAPTI